MKAIDIFRYCTFLHNGTSIPVTLFDKSNLVLQIPDGECPVVLEPYREQLLQETKPISFIATKQSILYGRLNIFADPKKNLIIGPVSSVPISKNMVTDMYAEARIPLRQAKEMIRLFESFPVISFHRFLHILCFIHYTVNGMVLTPEEIVSSTDRRYSVPIATAYTSKIYSAKEHQTFHNTYYFEKHILQLVEKGDLDTLKKLFDRPLHLTPGIIAEDNLRQAKNLFITTITLTTRAAIQGGLDIQEAYQLSDVYIQNMEKMTAIPSIQNLQYQMLFDFAERVSSSKIPAHLSRTIRECLSFIHNHTNQRVTLAEVAEHVRLSASHLSRKFKEELGIGVNAYINNQKIEEAKRLLTFTRLSLGEISSYLCYSSQSYFQKVFKKATGVTPNIYRADTSQFPDRTTGGNLDLV